MTRVRVVVLLSGAILVSAACAAAPPPSGGSSVPLASRCRRPSAPSRARRSRSPRPSRRHRRRTGRPRSPLPPRLRRPRPGPGSPGGSSPPTTRSVRSGPFSAGPMGTWRSERSFLDGATSRTPVWISSDGAAWQALPAGTFGPDAVVLGIVETPSTLIGLTMTGGANACGGEPSPMNCWTLTPPLRSWTSSDGRAWTAHPGPDVDPHADLDASHPASTRRSSSAAGPGRSSPPMGRLERTRRCRRTVSRGCRPRRSPSPRSGASTATRPRSATDSWPSAGAPTRPAMVSRSPRATDRPGTAGACRRPASGLAGSARGSASGHRGSSRDRRGSSPSEAPS